MDEDLSHIEAQLISDNGFVDALNEFHDHCDAQDQEECPGCQLKAIIDFLVETDDFFEHAEYCEDDDCDVPLPEEYVDHLCEDTEDALKLISRCQIAISALTKVSRAASYLIAIHTED